jgi:hypothetical protein
MDVRFDWQAADERGRWASIARVERRRMPSRVSWRACGAIVAALLLASAVAGLLVWRRYAAAQGRIAFQIQSIIDLEARALAEGDLALWLAQQDPMAPGWIEEQARRAEAGTLPTAPPRVARIEVRGDVAWVEVESGHSSRRRVRFYRRTGRGWTHTGPRLAFWRDPVEWDDGSVTVHCHERDRDQVEPLAQAVARAYDRACEQLDCPAPRRVQVRFGPEPALVDAPRAVPGGVWLASPWLSGVAAERGPDPTGLARASYWGRWAAAAQCVGLAPLDPLQRALVAEYAAWAGGEPAWGVPLLGRALEQHGPAALPLVYRSLQAGPALDVFLAEWLDLSAGEDPVAYLVALVQIEQESLYAGRRDTFLLLQDQAAWWREQQQTAFDRQQQVEPRRRPETTIERVVLGDYGARVTWQEHPGTSGREPRKQFSTYRRQEGGWVHAWRAFPLGPVIGFPLWSKAPEPLSER